jgi:hypothetical protein
MGINSLAHEIWSSHGSKDASVDHLDFNAPKMEAISFSEMYLPIANRLHLWQPRFFSDTF